MKSHRQELRFETRTRTAFVNITPRVEAALAMGCFGGVVCMVKAIDMAASSSRKRLLIKIIGE